MNLTNIGNYKDWIDPKWIEYALTEKGWVRPPPADEIIDDYHKRVYQNAFDHGYERDRLHFLYFKNKNFPFDIKPPWVTSDNYYWWIVKMLPGQFMIMHRDPDTEGNPTRIKRYWMPWQDYESGHIFIHNDCLISNYKKGDVFVYNTQDDEHGSCNIGYTPRLVLQVTEFLNE
jgi:hypothetical protein